MANFHEEMFQLMNRFRKLNISAMLPDISRMEYITMMQVMKAGPEERVSVSELTKVTHTLPPAMSRTLRGLEQKGYVERIVNPADRRNTYVVMTETGVSRMKLAKSIMKEFGAAVSKRVDPKEGERVIRYLNDIYEAAQEEISCRKWKDRKDNKDE